VLLGRAQKGDAPSGREHHHHLTKLAATASDFLRRDLEHARVHVTDLTSGHELDAAADGEGFFDVRVPGPLPPGKRSFRVEVSSGNYRAAPLDVELEVFDASAAGVNQSGRVANNKSSLEVLPLAPGACGQPPMPPMQASKRRTPACHAA